MSWISIAKLERKHMKLNEFMMFRRRSPSGTAVATMAHISRSLVWLLALHGMMGCLVTEEIEFSLEENLPPSVETGPSSQTPLNSLIIIQSDDPSELTEELALEVIVRDPNVSQLLRWGLFIDSPPAIADGEIPATGELRRDLRISVDKSSLLDNGCHRIELLVSTDFGLLGPEDPEDVGTGTWWVATVTMDDPTFDPNSCPGL